MKPFLLFFLLYILSIPLYSQQVLWAESYDISNCNEVAAMAVDTSGYIYMSGIHNAPPNVPYTGNCYLQKMDPSGDVIWTKYLSGMLQLGDMIAINNSVVLIGQSSGPFTYQEEEYGTSTYYLFMFKVDADGNHEWHIIDENKFGRYTNLAAGKSGDFVAQVRGQGNLGDWVWILNEDGDILNTKEISSTESTIVDIAYNDGWVYLNGGFNGPGSLIIDTIVINVQPIENTTFTLALDQDLTAKWVATDTTINNFDGQIAANETGIYVFEAVLEPPFTVLNYIKKFNTQGILIKEIVAPVFSNAIALYPDLITTPNLLGLFTKNEFGSESHAVFLFDHNLNLVSQKFVDGPSSNYSGQISNFEDDIFIAQVHSGNLTFSDEILLPYSGTGNLPYLAKIGNQSITNIPVEIARQSYFSVYPNPASEKITITIHEQEITDCSLIMTNLAGKKVLQRNIDKNELTVDINHLQVGVYLVYVLQNNGTSHFNKIIIQ